ncbi:MAG: hypothetical protein OEY01_16860 [Desulfobulbaceae bacterium]|nr:hypothetical protein [Desulfobulbaceae bacterium]HIJ80045.1 hypothetical protein [Deltaproteobacteria bacterium]
MVIPKKADKFIQGAASTKADKKPAPPNPASKYLLHLDPELRQKIRLESIEKGYPNMSEYICAILNNREQIKKI